MTTNHHASNSTSGNTHHTSNNTDNHNTNNDNMMISHTNHKHDTTHTHNHVGRRAGLLGLAAPLPQEELREG